MTDADLLSQAVAELYTTDLDAFTQRRGELAAAARAAGDRAAAKEISGLRRPTRSAWVVNRLVRSDPTAVSRLAQLRDELRSSEASGDGARMRELSQARRRLIESLVSDAMAAAGLDSPAVREEVSATLTAALADRDFAARMAEGSLLRAEPAPGFGSAGFGSAGLGSADLTAPTLPAPRPGRRAVPPAEAEGEAEAEAEAERRHREAIAKAEHALAEAIQAAEAAAEREQADEAAAREIQQQLADARRRLEETKRQARRADGAVRQAREALSRLR